MANNTKEEKLRQVPAIMNGTVIDHIPSEMIHRIFSILKIKNETATIGINLFSPRLGSKAILKVAEKFLDEHEVNKISVLAPSATLCIIKDYKVVEKSKLELRKHIEGIIKCSNPNCITNIDNHKTRFKVCCNEPLKVKCEYCERTMNRDEVNQQLI